MKKILFIRHSKSDWSNSIDIKDIDRPLNTRGVRSAYLMSERIKKQGLTPDILLSSPANRALHTTEIFARTYNNSHHKISISKPLYHPSVDDVFQELTLLSNTIETVFVFFHNPAINEIGYQFVHNFSSNVPTCGILGFEINISVWKDYSPREMKFLFFDYPKKKQAEY